MQSITIRRASSEDLAHLSHLWHEKTLLQNQSDHRFQLMPDAPLRWLLSAREWLTQPQCAIWVAASDEALVGYLVAWVKPSAPGLLPEKMGVVTDMTIAIHDPQSSGTARLLLQVAQAWMREQNITVMTASIPHRQVVEQAFWTSLGATRWEDTLWLKL